MTHIIAQDELQEMRQSGYTVETLLFASPREQKRAFMVTDPFDAEVYFKLVPRGETVYTCNDIYDLVNEYNKVSK